LALTDLELRHHPRLQKKDDEEGDERAGMLLDRDLRDPHRQGRAQPLEAADGNKRADGAAERSPGAPS
jgi:hypothetical protein